MTGIPKMREDDQRLGGKEFGDGAIFRECPCVCLTGMWGPKGVYPVLRGIRYRFGSC